MELSQKTCIPCGPGEPPLSELRVRELARGIPGWALSGGDTRLRREIRFRDFGSAMAYVARVAVIAEKERHHPDLAVEAGLVTLTLWTRSIGGLSENDFILAAKIDTVRPQRVA
jgi:4a-hydroxytetrahydrobiopterin dehydratase